MSHRSCVVRNERSHILGIALSQFADTCTEDFLWQTEGCVKEPMQCMTFGESHVECFRCVTPDNSCCLMVSISQWFTKFASIQFLTSRQSSSCQFLSAWCSCIQLLDSLQPSSSVSGFRVMVNDSFKSQSILVPASRQRAHTEQHEIKDQRVRGSQLTLFQQTGRGCLPGTNGWKVGGGGKDVKRPLVCPKFTNETNCCFTPR